MLLIQGNPLLQHKSGIIALFVAMCHREILLNFYYLANGCEPNGMKLKNKMGFNGKKTDGETILNDSEKKVQSTSL